LSPVFKSTLIGCLLLPLVGCTGIRQSPGPSPDMPAEQPETVPMDTPAPEPDPFPPHTVEVPPEKPSPRALASLELSTQAEMLIQEGRLDEAIRTLEQAVNLHPGSGEGYYYLAEAWRLKGNLSQAEEFNTLAAIRFKDDPEWMRRIDVQKRRIERMN
jgi:tetratricopeptide (TPR) repeat protein